MPRRGFNLARSRNLPDPNDYASILRSPSKVTRVKLIDLITSGIVSQAPSDSKLVFSEEFPRLTAKITKEAWIYDGLESFTSVSGWLSHNLLKYVHARTTKYF